MNPGEGPMEKGKTRSIETLDNRGVVRFLVFQVLEKLAVAGVILALLYWGGRWLWARLDEWI